MTLLKPPYQYVIDSSALFDLKNLYPERIFPGVWERFNEMCEQKLIIAPKEVLKEIKKGNDELVLWTDNYTDIFLEPCDDEILIVQNVLTNYPQEILLKNSIGIWADPFVIASALYYKLPIIQHESNQHYKIPQVAKLFNIKCQRLIEFFDDENWQFIPQVGR